MCGLVGYMDMDQERRISKTILTRMMETLHHRGPDSHGCFLDENIGLGFQRLSIIDIVGGNQPLFNEDRSVLLVCNGEIYNHIELRTYLLQKGHTFRTKSDVEVIIHLYEEEGFTFLNKLNGQFAFALYDQKENSLFLARDHFGIAPLHYTCTDGLFIFASEIKAILEHPAVYRAVNLTGLDQILSFPGLVSPTTMFENIHSLPSGHAIVIKDFELKITQYWDLDYPKEPTSIDTKPEHYYQEKLLEILTSSVKYRLQADVPVGFYLSGGLDSSLIAALINKVSAGASRNSFSIGFASNHIDESRYQKLMVDHIRSNHREIVFDWNQIASNLTKMVYHCECPVKETYNTCSLSLSKAVKETGISVILTGEGADELFAGYIGYRFDKSGMRVSNEYDVQVLLEDELRERLWGDSNLFYEKEQFSFRETKTAVYSSQLNNLFHTFDCLNFPLVDKTKLKGRHPIHQRSYLDFKLRLADHLLSDHGDRMALANSVEARYPFLDINLVEFATQIPPNLKLNDYTEKYILKKVAGGLVPDAIIEREKFGFRAPGSPYLLQQNIEWINDLLSYERIKRQGYFQPDVVEYLKSRYVQKGFEIHPHLEDDLLLFVLTFCIFLDVFKMPSLR